MITNKRWYHIAWHILAQNEIVTVGEGLNQELVIKKPFIQHMEIGMDLTSWALPLCFISGVLVSHRETIGRDPWYLYVLCFRISFTIRSRDNG